MQRYAMLYISCFMLGLSACGEETDLKSEPPRQQPFNYSQETLDKVEKDVNQALQKSMDRLESVHEQ